MRFAVITFVSVLIANSVAFGQQLSEEQMGPWSALEEQVGMDVKQDWEGMGKFLHPKACFWGDAFPTPLSWKAYSYYQKLRAGQDKVVAHHLVPVSVIVVGDVATINFYAHTLTEDEDGGQVEKIIRGHNTWKKEDGHWLLLSNYNTVVKDGDDEDDD